MARKKDRPRVDQPADVTLEASLWSDPRFALVASKTGLDVFSVRARVARVWSACTDREITTLPEKHVDMFAECAGFGLAMVEAELAEGRSEGLYIRGTQGRIDWLKDCRARAAVGGRKTADGRRKRQAPAVASAVATGAATATPNAAPCAEPPASEVLCPRNQVLGSRNVQKSPAETLVSESLFPSLLPDPETSEVASAPQRAVTDHWERRYVAQAGRKPTWKTQHFANLKRLLAAHSAQVVGEAIDVLFDAPPKFLAGSLPDFDTLVQHFDKLAVAARSPPVSNGVDKARALLDLAAKARGAR